VGAREQLHQLQWQQGQIVKSNLAPGEQVLDSGSARAENVPDRPPPSGSGDFGGFLLITDQQLIYHDFFGTPSSGETGQESDLNVTSVRDIMDLVEASDGNNSPTKRQQPSEKYKGRLTHNPL